MENLFRHIDNSRLWSQVVPLSLTVVVFIGLIAILHLAVIFFNFIPFATPIHVQIRWYDVVVGATIYLKTSIDFAIVIGRLMATYPGWRGRVAIEIGTAAGNAVGTIVVIGLWVLLKHIDVLLALMIFFAALVLLELAHESLEQISWSWADVVKRILNAVRRFTGPVVSWIMPDLGHAMQGRSGLSWAGLLRFSTTVPFILGLDDFAGYVPLFSVINVYGFAIGVIAAHTILNIALFLSPRKTMDAVKNEYVSFAGALAFVGLSVYGVIESVKIIASLF